MKLEKFEKRCEALVGKEIHYLCYDEVGDLCVDEIGVIANCDPYIGLTVVGKFDKENYILCLVGPYAPNYGSASLDKYINSLTGALTKLESGTYVHEMHLGNRFNSSPNAESCPFNQ